MTDLEQLCNEINFLTLNFCFDLHCTKDLADTCSFFFVCSPL